MSVVAKCEECEHVFDVNDSESPLYECGNCGTRYNRDGSADGSSHKCPDCNKFGSKVSDWACPECGEGEGVETEAFKCPGCDEWQAIEDGEMSEGSKPKGKKQADPLNGKDLYVIAWAVRAALGEDGNPFNDDQKTELRALREKTFRLIDAQ